MRAVLGNVEELKRDYPGFQAPPVEHREDLRPGDLAELMLLTDQYPESIWAQVEDVPGPGWYRGVLETGEPIEFGPEHVSDIKVPSPQMGAEKMSVFDFFHPGREPKPGARPSIWNLEEHAAWVDAERARKAAEAGQQPKRGFWDWLRRKPKYELAPIPQPERRSAPRPRGMLPGPVEIFDEPKPEARPRPEGPPPPAPTIIVPQAPVGPIDVPETIIEHGSPTSYFDVLGPGPAEPPPPPSGGLILVPEAPPPVAPQPTGGMVLAPQQPEVDVFAVLGPGPDVPAPSTGLIVSETRTTLPAQADVFDVLAPEAPRGMVRHEVTPFDVLAPEPPSGGMVRHEVTPFDVLAPEPPSGGMVPVTEFDVIAAPPAGPVTPFDVLAPEPSSGLVVHEPSSVFDVLAAQEATFPEDVTWGGVPTGPMEPSVEEESPKRKRKKKLKMDIHSSIKSWEEWIRENFDLDEVWEHVRKELSDPYHKHYQAHEDGSGMPATIGILTWENGNWDDFASYLGIPYKEIKPYVDKMEIEAEEVGAYDLEWEKFQEEVVGPISDGIHKAFDRLKPSDLKGHFYLEDDGKTEGQAYGIIYYEKMTEKERRDFLREESRQEEEERRGRAEHQAQVAQKAKDRQKELRRIWGRIPEVDELAAWVGQIYPPEFWRNLKKNRNSKAFQAELENAAGQGEAGVMEIEAIADEGPYLHEQLSSYFGIPPDIFQVYLGGIRPEEEESAEGMLWNEVLTPYFEIVAEALNREKPRGLPGELVYEWDDDDQQFFLKYIESTEE